MEEIILFLKVAENLLCRFSQPGKLGFPLVAENLLCRFSQPGKIVKFPKVFVFTQLIAI